MNKVHLVDPRDPEMVQRFDIEYPYCGLVHWPEASRYADSYYDRTTDPASATCGRCLSLSRANGSHQLA